MSAGKWNASLIITDLEVDKIKLTTETDVSSVSPKVVGAPRWGRSAGFMKSANDRNASFSEFATAGNVNFIDFKVDINQL